MKPDIILKHQFVEFIPEHLEEETIYVSIKFATASHNCFCGCGSEVVTPLTPTDWELIFNGKTISFRPSIGNWSFDCQSHYWITNNRVRWAARMSPEQIAAGRYYDRTAKQRYYNPTSGDSKGLSQQALPTGSTPEKMASFWGTLKRWIWR